MIIYFSYKKKLKLHNVYSSLLITNHFVVGVVIMTAFYLIGMVCFVQGSKPPFKLHCVSLTIHSAKNHSIVLVLVDEIVILLPRRYFNGFFYVL